MFIAVHEPHAGEPFIEKVETRGAEIWVFTKDFVDVIDREGDAELRITRARGTEAFGEWYLGREGPTGAISSATRTADGAEVDAFLTDADLPVGDDLSGVWIILTHGNGHAHGYEIDRIDEVDGQRRIVLTADHGLRIDGDATREVYYPRRTIEGPNTFRIPLASPS